MTRDQRQIRTNGRKEIAPKRNVVRFTNTARKFRRNYGRKGKHVTRTKIFQINIVHNYFFTLCAEHIKVLYVKDMDF